MRNHLFPKLISFFLMLLLLAACGAKEETAAEKDNGGKSETQPYSVTDDAGTEYTFDKAPERVISLSPAVTEILFELGVGDKVVGVTNYDTYPDEVKEIEAVSDLININVEKIVSLKPDVVFIYLTKDENGIQALKDAGIKVFVISDAASFEEAYANYEKVAKVMGVEEKGKELASKVKKEVEEISEKLAGVKEKKRVYLEISPAPSMFTTGKNSFQNEILEKAGLENIFSEQEGWFAPSEEEIIKQNPDVILTTVSYNGDSVEEIKNRRGWNKITAVQNNQVYFLDSDIMSRPGPRIAQAVELTAKTVYPELFE